MLGPGRHLEHHALPVEGAHLDLRAEQGLRQIDRHDTDHVEALAPEEPIRLDLNHHHDVAAPFGALALQAQPRPILGPRRDGDREVLLRPHLARALAGRTALRRYLAPPPTNGAGPLHGESTLPERDRAPALAFRAC